MATSQKLGDPNGATFRSHRVLPYQPSSSRRSLEQNSWRVGGAQTDSRTPLKCSSSGPEGVGSL